jgi:3-isopropylmalate/(R)-2-methylmalate dehydratase small subunit
MIIKGRVWVFDDEINTDLIFPHSAFRVSPEEQAKLVFSDNRPGWSSLVQKGDILIAGKNFGTGSSRPGAALLRRLGLAGMAADSITAVLPQLYRYGFPGAAGAPGRACLRKGRGTDRPVGGQRVKNERTGEILVRVKSQAHEEILLAGGMRSC